MWGLLNGAILSTHLRTALLGWGTPNVSSSPLKTVLFLRQLVGLGAPTHVMSYGP